MLSFLYLYRKYLGALTLKAVPVKEKHSVRSRAGASLQPEDAVAAVWLKREQAVKTEKSRDFICNFYGLQVDFVTAEC